MRKFTLLSLLSLCVISASAQTQSLIAGVGFPESISSRTTAESWKSSMDAFKPSESDNGSKDFKNIIKINLTSLVFTAGSFQYERLLNNKMSVAMGLWIRPSSGLPFRSAIVNAVASDDQDTKDFINGIKMGGFAFTPEFRYYFGKEAGRGFYLAPFVRYEQFNLKTIYNLEMDTTGTKTPVPFKGQIATFGIGILIGSQFHISSRLTLDWWILGPYYTSNSLKLSAYNLDLDSDAQQDLRESLDGTELGWAKISSEVSATEAHLNAKGSFAAIRGFGLCLGLQL